MSLVSPNHFVCKPPPEADILLTSVETAMYLRVSLKTLDRWAKLGIGPEPLKVGSRRRYRLCSVRSAPQPAWAA
jgi:hypothetical protein